MLRIPVVIYISQYGLDAVQFRENAHGLIAVIGDGKSGKLVLHDNFNSLDQVGVDINGKRLAAHAIVDGYRLGHMRNFLCDFLV